LPQFRASALQVPEHFGDIVVVDEKFVTAAHGAGLAVHVWTINDAESMGRLCDLGVDGIISDVPSVLAGVLGGTGTQLAAGRLAPAPKDWASRARSSDACRGWPSSST